MKTQKVIYQEKEFFVKGSVIKGPSVDIALAIATDGAKGIFDIRTGRLLHGLFEKEDSVLMVFDQVNNLWSNHLREDGKEETALLIDRAEPI